MTWKRILLYVVAANCIFFFRSCDQAGNLQLTSGAFAAHLTVEIDESGAHERFELDSFSPVLLIVNLGLVAIPLLLIKRRLPRLDRFLGGTPILVALAMMFALFNSVLIPNAAWVYGVFWPTGYLYEFVANFTVAGQPASPPNALLDLVGRFYFAILFSLLGLLCFAIARIRRHANPPSEEG